MGAGGEQVTYGHRLMAFFGIGAFSSEHSGKAPVVTIYHIWKKGSATYS